MSDSTTDPAPLQTDPWGMPMAPPTRHETPGAPAYPGSVGVGSENASGPYVPGPFPRPLAGPSNPLIPDAIPPHEPRWMNFDPERPVPRWGMPDIVLGLLVWLVATMAFIIPAIIVVPRGDTGELTKGAEAIVGLVGLGGSWFGMVGWLVFLSRFKGQKSLKLDFGFKMRWFDPLVGFGAGLAILVPVSVAIQVVADAFGVAPGENKDSVFPDTTNIPLVLVTALMASIGAPIVEELFFRGLVFRAIGKRLGTVVGIVASSLVFGLLHWQGATVGTAVSLVTGITVMGIAFALLARWQGRLGPAIFAHMTINGLASITVLVEELTR